MTTCHTEADETIDPVDSYAKDMSDTVRSLINESMSRSDRSLYAQSNKIGVSDIGYCREYVRRTIVGVERDEEQDDYLAAFIGTSVGDRLEDEFIKRFPDEGWVKQAEVTVTLDVMGYRLFIVGHPDLYNPSELIDFKTVDGLGATIRGGATTQQRFQLTLYAKALIAEGKMADTAMLSLVYVDRSGSEPKPHVISWQYDEDVVREAEEWLADVIYAVQHDEEASRDKPRSWCEKVCEFYSSCRAYDTDVEGLIDDPFILNALEVYEDAKDRIKQAEKDKKSAQSLLENISGSTGTQTIRWVEVGPTEVSFTRKGYRKLDIRRVPIKKQGKAE